MLAGNDAVQKELKLTDKQKAQVKKISEDSNNRRRDVFQNLRQQADTLKNQAAQQAQAEAADGQQIDPSLAARGSGAGNPLINSLNNRGYQPPIYGGQPLDDPAAAQQAQQGQGQAGANGAQAQGWQMMREAMDQLQNESDRELGKALDKNQVKRLKEIQLQVEGPFAVLRPEIAEKLELGEEQVPRSRRSRTRATRHGARPSPPAATSSRASGRASRAITTSRVPLRRIPTRLPARHRTEPMEAATVAGGTVAAGMVAAATATATAEAEAGTGATAAPGDEGTSTPKPCGSTWSSRK